VVEHCWTRKVSAGEILIQEGETGLAASELYVVKDGTFEVGAARWQCYQSEASARPSAAHSGLSTACSSGRRGAERL
jgi:hypothetical protein